MRESKKRTMYQRLVRWYKDWRLKKWSVRAAPVLEWWGLLWRLVLVFGGVAMAMWSVMHTANIRYSTCVTKLTQEMNTNSPKTPACNYVWARKECAGFMNIAMKSKWDKR